MELSYKEFIKICKEADQMVEKAKRKDVTLTSHKPINLKAAAIHHLAQTMPLSITLHNLYAIYGVTPSTIIEIRHQITRALQLPEVTGRQPKNSQNKKAGK